MQVHRHAPAVTTPLRHVRLHPHHPHRVPAISAVVVRQALQPLTVTDRLPVPHHRRHHMTATTTATARAITQAAPRLRHEVRLIARRRAARQATPAVTVAARTHRAAEAAEVAVNSYGRGLQNLKNVCI